MIACERLTRKYGTLTAVDRVSFEINQGEIVGLLGHNGAGKTTIMKMMTGYLEPTEGRVLVDGKDMDDHRRPSQSKIGYLPENGPLYPDMTVLDFLSFTADLRGIPMERRDQAVRDALQKTDLLAKGAQSIQTLSRGYRQRVGVAQALIHKPPILILDEPTNGLDPSQVLQMRSLIRDLGRGSIVVLSTHILQEVEAVCDRVLIVLNGRLVMDKKLSELKASERLLVTVDRSPREAEPALRELDGVEGVDHLGGQEGEHRYALSLREGRPVREAAPTVARGLVQKGFAVYSLAPERRDLETVFREVNTQHESAEEGGRR
ncbi:MAG: ATP-binding cassette domain-containing protein [Elusimicrobia bacterium]|nr:ATP-binding cassette domain-containing protein [Elusimicrobiota bacterium]